MSPSNIKRRHFITQAALAAAGLVGKSALAISASREEKQAPLLQPLTFSVFSKNLQWLNYQQMADAAAEMGFNGVDLTVRPKGHVLPERVETDLPAAVKAIRSRGLDVYMITTAIANASEPYTAKIIKTASALGIKNYRMGWFEYDKKLSATANISQFTKTLAGLQQLNKQYGIHGAYQNHAGESFGSAVIDLYMAIKDLDPQWIGCQYDIRHATVEGANSWPTGFNLLQKHIKTINLKDVTWLGTGANVKAENVPLGAGMVNFERYTRMLASAQFNGPVCIHYEYPLGGAEDGASSIKIPPEEVLSHMKTDLEKARKLFAAAGFGG